MKWNKQGLIYVPDGALAWAKSHAMIPTPELIDDCIRIYISSCDEYGVARISFVDVDANNPKRILDIANTPLLDVGVPGTFDENGAVVTSIVNLPDGRKFLYYVEFEIGTKIRYRLLTGVAYSNDNGRTFKRFNRTPVLERSEHELYFRCGSFVMLDEGIFKLWYVAGSNWIEINNKYMPVYTINYLESTDGITWPTRGHICIPITSSDEHGFGRPYVIKEDGCYKMFYSIRLKQQGYRLGYAESKNGIDWIRKDDELGLDVSADGWDSETLCYSSIVRYADQTYLFYNGNDFGRTGFGYACLENND